MPSTQLDEGFSEGETKSLSDNDMNYTHEDVVANMLGLSESEKMLQIQQLLCALPADTRKSECEDSLSLPDSSSILLM